MVDTQFFTSEENFTCDTMSRRVSRPKTLRRQGRHGGDGPAEGVEGFSWGLERRLRGPLVANADVAEFHVCAQVGGRLFKRLEEMRLVASKRSQVDRLSGRSPEKSEVAHLGSEPGCPNVRLLALKE